MGKGTYFPGLIPLVLAYLDATGCDQHTRTTLTNYLTLIRKRASGELVTNAHWMRAFIAKVGGHCGGGCDRDCDPTAAPPPPPHPPPPPPHPPSYPHTYCRSTRITSRTPS
jgi:hypothetical protein